MADRGSRIPGPGPRDEWEPAPWTRTDTWALAALVLGALASLPWLVHPWFDRTPDGSMYLVTTRSLLSGLGHTLYGAPFFLRPPGFSWLLAPLVARGADFAALHTYVHLFGVAAIALLFVFQRRRVGTAAAFGLAVVLWLTPGFRILCNQIMSDVPGVALLLAGLLLDRAGRRKPSVAGEILLGSFLGLAATVRTVVILLVPAMIASRAVDRMGERGPRTPLLRFLLRDVGAVALGAMIVQVPLGRALGPPADADPADQTARFSYSSGMWHRDEGDPGSERIPLPEILRERLPARLPDLAAAFGSQAVHDDLTARRAALAALLGLAMLWVAVKRRAPADFFVLGAFALFSVYFGFKPRLVLPLYVIALPALFETFGDLVRPWAGAARARGATVVAVLAWLALTASPRPEWERVRRDYEAFAADRDALAAALPPGGALGTGIAWDWAAGLERPVFSLTHHVLRVGDAARGTEDMIERYGLRTLFVDPELKSDREVWEYVRTRYGDGTPDGGFARAGRFRIVPVRTG